MTEETGLKGSEGLDRQPPVRLRLAIESGNVSAVAQKFLEAYYQDEINQGEE